MELLLTMSTRTANVRRRLAFLGTVIVPLGGCAGGNGTDTGRDRVFEGSVTRLSGAPCRDLQMDLSDDIIVGEKRLAVRDEDGRIVGATTTDPARLTRRPSGGCEMRALYRVELEEADFYTFELEGPVEPSVPASAAELEDAGYACSLEVEISDFVDEPDKLAIVCE